MSSDAALLLVHGGYHGAWVWGPLLPHVDRRSLAVDLPGRGAHPAQLDDVTIDACAASVASDVEAAELGPLVLVAHSLAGVLAPAIADRLGGRVERLVFVASLIAPDGQSAFDAFSPDMRARASERLQHVGGGASEITEDQHRAQLCNDLDDQQASWLVSRLVPESLHLFTDVVRWGAAIDLPCHYVKLTRDLSLSPGMQDEMVRKLPRGAVVYEIDAGHEVMVSRPAALADVLSRL